MNDQERLQYLKSLEEGKVTLMGVEASVYKDLMEGVALYKDKEQRLRTVNSMAQTLQNELVALQGQISALSKILCQSEDARRVENRVTEPALTLEELGKKLGAEKVEFVPNR